MTNIPRTKAKAIYKNIFPIPTKHPPIIYFIIFPIILPLILFLIL